jgi:Dyp-type peroxidase family
MWWERDMTVTTAAMHTREPQQGILNRPPEHILVASFKLLGERMAAPTRATLAALRELLHKELQSELDHQDESTDKAQPSPETGELGFSDHYDRQHLTVTLGLGAGCFDALQVGQDQRPADLIPMPWDQLKDAPTITPDNGDFVVQVCADDPYVVEHVLRRIEEELGDRLGLVWVVQGVQRYTTREGRVSTREARALNGFLDGTANLDPKNVDTDRQLVFVNPDPAVIAAYPPLDPSSVPSYGQPQGPTFPADLRQPPTHEPEWTRGGTYMVVRASVQKTRDWDRAPLGDVVGSQEHAIGRWKYSGASLDRDDDPSQLDVEPAFAADQTRVDVAITSHIRKVNPRFKPADALRRIFRRGYPLIEPAPGELQRGLIFVCFARSISTQFEFIVRGWMVNPDFPHPQAGIDELRERFELRVLCGGYFFVPPLQNAQHPWSWVLPA